MLSWLNLPLYKVSIIGKPFNFKLDSDAIIATRTIEIRKVKKGQWSEIFYDKGVQITFTFQKRYNNCIKASFSSKFNNSHFSIIL